MLQLQLPRILYLPCFLHIIINFFRAELIEVKSDEELYREAWFSFEDAPLKWYLLNPRHLYPRHLKVRISAMGLKVGTGPLGRYLINIRRLSLVLWWREWNILIYRGI